jgi:hypothetical protein
MAATAVFVTACSIYANLSFAVTDPAAYRFFPPFEAYRNANENRNAVAATEYAHIGWSLFQGEGFANLFGRDTGATAWMPPVLPAILAGLFWIRNGNRDAVMVLLIVMQTLVLIGTGFLVLALVRKTTKHVGTGVAATAFSVGLLQHFRLCFQRTDDCWVVLLALDLLIAGLTWFDPLGSAWRAAVWGIVGGICSLINPVIGFAWGALSLPVAWRRRGWFAVSISLAVAGLTLAPWTIRNYLVLGRWIPVKSNLAYELYQSQCLQADGLIQRATFLHHPGRPNKEAQEYDTLGEIAYLDYKCKQFWQAVRPDPKDFAERVAERFLGATLWYVPFDRNEGAVRPWVFWCSRFIHPLPFMAVLVLLLTAFRQPLDWAQWTVLGVYLFYLLPYVVIGYYERYAVPLLAAKVLLVVWAIDRLWRR